MSLFSATYPNEKNPINCFKEVEGDANFGLAYKKKKKTLPCSTLYRNIRKRLFFSH